jgi:hypothetical protein
MRHKKLEMGVLNGEARLIIGEMVRRRYRVPAMEYATSAVYATTLLKVKKHVIKPAPKSRIARWRSKGMALITLSKWYALRPSKR